MKAMIKSIVAALAIVVGLNAWADSKTFYGTSVVEANALGQPNPFPTEHGDAGVWVTKSYTGTPDYYCAADSSDDYVEKKWYPTVGGKEPTSADLTFYAYHSADTAAYEFLNWTDEAGNELKTTTSFGWTWCTHKFAATSTSKSEPTVAKIYANFHVHNKQYVQNGQTTIEHKCVNTATTCKNSCGSSYATLVAADEKEWDGTPYTATVEGDSANATITYKTSEDQTIDAPTESGNYVVVMTYGDKAVMKNFTITHRHLWRQNEPSNGSVTWTCTNGTCSTDTPTVTLDAADMVYTGTAAAFGITKSEGFDALLPALAIGEVKYYKGETEIAAPKYTGSYTAKVTVGEKTLVKGFSITKPEGGYWDGWEVNNTATSVRYDSWEEALAAAADNDTVVYYRDGDRDYETQNFSVGNKNLTIDFNGKTLTKSAYTTLTIVNEGGTGVLTFQNVVIDQPRGYTSSGQIETKGNIVFGSGVVVNNTATQERNYCTITSKSGTLEVTDGLYQCGFATDGGSVVVSGGKYWENDDPSAFLKAGYEIREISGDYKYEVFGHTHSFKYEAEGNVITLVCEGEESTEDCPYNKSAETLTLVAPDAKWTGSPYAGAKTEVTAKFADGGATVGAIEYWAKGGEQALAGAPTDQGYYVAKVTAGDVTAEQEFTITHTHGWKYTAEGDTITATCTNEPCILEAAPKAVISVEDQTFTGAVIEPATLVKDKAFEGEVTLSYEPASPKAVGTYTVKATIGTAVATKTFEITKADIDGITAEMKTAEFDFKAAEIENTLGSAKFGNYTLASGDYVLSGTTKAFGSGYSNETYTVTLTGSGNFKGTKTVTWTIKAPTGSFASSEKTAGVGGIYEGTTLTLTNGCDYVYASGLWAAGVKATYPEDLNPFIFFKPQHAIFTADGEMFTGEAPKNGVTVDTGKVAETYMKSFTYTVGFTAAQLEAAAGADLTNTATACALVWKDGVYHHDTGIRATDFNVVAKTAGIVLPLPAAATHDIGATLLANVKINLGAGAKVTTTTEQTAGQIFTEVAGYDVVKTFDQGTYTYTAQEHQHDWKYEKGDGSYTASCKRDKCTVTATVKIVGTPEKSYDGTALEMTLDGKADFETLTGKTVSGLSYSAKSGSALTGGKPVNAGSYSASFTVNNETVARDLTISAVDVKGATTGLTESYNYDFSKKVNSLGTVKVGNLTLAEGDYEVAAGSQLEGTGNGKTNETFTVTINGKGNFTGTKTVEWTIKAPETELADNAATAGGEIAGTTLWMTNGANYGWTYYTAENAPDGSGIAGFYAGVKVKWPTSSRHTDLENGFFKVNGATAWTNALEVKKGNVPGLTCDAIDILSIFSSIQSVTWWQRLTVEELKAAEGETVEKTLAAIGLVWGKDFGVFGWYGDGKGVKETDFTIVTKLAGLELYDNEGYKVWPEHNHTWTWTVGEGGNVLTAACAEAGCKYVKNPLVLTIAPTAEAEKYCDTKPLTAVTAGGEAMAEITGATVGEVEYFADDEELGEAPTLPGEYAAKCTVVSKDLTATNTIETALTILTGQAIWNGVHVADAAEYLEKKTQDDMEIFVGKDFTASKTFVVPASWKAGTVTEFDMTIKQFIEKVKNGDFGDLYTWDDFRDLIAGRTTLKELFKRLKDVSEEFTLIDCGVKTFDLNGFTVTAAEGAPLIHNLGTLMLKGEGTAQTDGEVLLVNDGTLSIEAGTYVGSITNTGALVISGGYFTGKILNAGEGTVVLTGGAYEIKPNKDFVPAGYDLVKRDGIWYVEKHEHNYTFLPLGKCMMSCTCWNWFVDDPDQLIQFSNCNAHKLGVFIATHDGILPTRKFAYTGKPVEANVVGYNYWAILRIGVLKNIKELVAIAEEAEDADEKWNEMSEIEKIQKMANIFASIDALDIDFTDLVWSQERVAEETGLKFGPVEYYDDDTDEKLSGAPVEAGSYRASVVITTLKGNEVTRSWRFTIGTDYKTSIEKWAAETKEDIEEGWKKFKEKIQSAFDRQPTEEETVQYFDEIEQSNAEYLQSSSSKYDEYDQKVIDAHNKLVEDIRNAHLKAKAWAQNAAAEIKDFYDKHNGENLDVTKEALEKAWKDFCDKVEKDWGRLPKADEIEDFFDGLDEDVRNWFEEQEEKGHAIDEKIIKAHGDMVEELKAVHTSIVKWVNETFDRAEEAAAEETESAPMLMAVQEEEKTGWEKFKDDVKAAFGRLPSEEEVEAFFEAEGIRHAQFVENLKAKGVTVDEKIKAAHDEMVVSLKDAHKKLVNRANAAADELKELYEKHEETYFDEAHKALQNAWNDFCEDVGGATDWDVKGFFDEADRKIRAWFEERKQNHEPVDEKIIAAHEAMVKELKTVHASMVKWIGETFGKLEAEAEEEAAPAPLLTMAAAPMAAAIEEEELSGWEKFKQDVKGALGRLPTEEEIAAFFEAEGKRHAQFLETLKAKGVTFPDELKAAHDKMVETIKGKNAKLVQSVENAVEELKALYVLHEDKYFDDAADAIEKAWNDFCEEIGVPTYEEAEEFFEGIGQQLKPWFDELEAKGEPVDEKIIEAHDKMVEELKDAHAAMVAWLKGRFEQVSDSELKALPEEESEEAPALLALSVADESKAYDGTGVEFELKGKAYFEQISGCTVEGPYYRPIKPEGPVTDVPPTAPGHYEIFFKIFKGGKQIEFVVKHVFYIEKLLADHVVVYFASGKNFVYNGEEQGPTIWGVYCGLDELKGGDYTITGTTNATEAGDYAFTVKGHGVYEMYEETFNWSIAAPTGTFEEGAFQIRSELEYNAETKTWDTVATLDWPRDLRQIFRKPRYYAEDVAVAETTANYVDPTVVPVLREFFRIKTGEMEQYVKADVWTLPFTPEQLTEAANAGYTAVTNTLTAYALASENAPEGMAPTNFEYVVNLEGLKLYDDKGRQCYPIHKHEWKFTNAEDGTLNADCYSKSCPTNHASVSIAAESKGWDSFPVRAEIVDVDDQFAIHTYAEFGPVRYVDAEGAEFLWAPSEPGEYTAFAQVVTPGAVTNRVWKKYAISTIDIANATVYTVPNKTEFVYSETEHALKVDAVIVNGRLLTKGVDYTVGGTAKATDVGNYQIVIEGKGHYAGVRTIDWAVVEPTREFAEEAFDQVAFDVPGPFGRKPYGEVEGKVLTITASTNLWYDVTTSNWYAGVTVDWPYELGQICHAPQFTVPEKAYVEVAAPTYTNVYTALDIMMGKATNENLVADVGEFYRLRYLTWQKFVKRIGWDVEITLADIVAAREQGETSITYAITVGSPANREDPDGLAKTTYQIVLPLEGLVLEDDQTNRYHVAAFDANGGAFADGQKTNALVVVEGQPFGELPANPAYDGHTFTKWLDASGREITAETVFAEGDSEAVIAQWNLGYVNTYDANGGAYETGGTQKQCTVKLGSSDFCDISWIGAAREGFVLTGWFDAPEGGEQVYSDKGIWLDGTYWKDGIWQYSGAITIYAQWKKRVSFTVTYDGNGSLLRGGLGIEQCTVTLGKSDFCDISWIGAEREDQVLTGWFTARDGGEKVYDYYGISVNGTYWQDHIWKYAGDLTVYAQWMPGYWVNFDCMGFGLNCKYPVQIGSGNFYDVSWIPVAREGYEFAGWYTKPLGGEMVYDAKGIAVDGTYWKDRIWQHRGAVTVYPHWRKPGGYVVTCDFNDADRICALDVAVGSGDFFDISWIGALRDGFVLTGWFTDPEGGEQVYDADGQAVDGTYWQNSIWQYEGDLTVYAQWQPIQAPMMALKMSVSSMPKTFAFAGGVYSGMTVDGGVFTVLLEDGVDGTFDAYLYVDGETYDAEATAAGEVLTIETEDDVYVMTKVAGVWTLARQ